MKSYMRYNCIKRTIESWIVKNRYSLPQLSIKCTVICLHRSNRQSYSEKRYLFTRG